MNKVLSQLLNHLIERIVQGLYETPTVNYSEGSKKFGSYSYPLLNLQLLKNVEHPEPLIMPTWQNCVGKNGYFLSGLWCTLHLSSSRSHMPIATCEKMQLGRLNDLNAPNPSPNIGSRCVQYPPPLLLSNQAAGQALVNRPRLGSFPRDGGGGAWNECVCKEMGYKVEP